MTRCDFCGAPNPTWDFPCADFLALIVGVAESGEVEVLPPQGYRGAWSACETCKALIEAGEWRYLAERGADAQGPLTGEVREATIQGITQVHRSFREHRAGAPVRLGA